MSNRAAIYLRSSKDRSDVSLDAQRRALHDLAQTKNLTIVDEFVDAVESGKDEDRPAFQLMIRALRAKDRGWEHVMALDTSRVARRRHIALIFEHECEKADITIHYRNLPDSDPISTMLLKSILQAMDEWHSLTSKAKGMAGMAENVRQGWRAGGRAPRGYKLDYTATGAIRDGAPVLKSKLTPNEESESVAAYMSGRAAGESRGALIARLALDWPASSFNSIEWQALTYAGHTVWGVHNEANSSGGYRTGEKRKPRSEWLVTNDTHQALITSEEAESILNKLEGHKTFRTRTHNRVFLLTGLLQSPDGTSWSGEWDARMDAGQYRLGKGRKISARRIDGAVLDRIRSELQSEIVLTKICKAMQSLIDEPVDGRKIAGLEKKVATATNKIGKVVDLLTDASPELASAYKRTIYQAESERTALIEELNNLRQRAEISTAAQNITPSEVRQLMHLMFENLKSGIDAGEVETIKAALSGLIDRITLDPVSENCTIHFRIDTSDTGVKLASPRVCNLTPVTWSAEVVLLSKWAA
jgi:DNA invertase Pin-like site-specific DNA recombinase